MAFYMVHGNERNTQAHSSGLGKVKAHKHRSDKAGSVRCRNGVDIAFFYSGCLHGALGKARYDLNVASRRYLRHYAAVNCVQICLREYLIRKHISAVFNDGDGGLIAG